MPPELFINLELVGNSGGEMMKRKEYEEIRENFEAIDNFIASKKPKRPELRDKLWEIFQELNN